jgi:hypothetical protein
MTQIKRYVTLAQRQASPEYFETRSKKDRGMAQASLDLIEAMHEEAKAAEPISGRGVGHKVVQPRPQRPRDAPRGRQRR